ncbi:hypothetical protein ACWKWN_18390 [Microbacterium trichothecenolyticum]
MTNEDSTARPIHAASVTALVLAVIAAASALFLVHGLKGGGALLAVAAIIIGVFASINASHLGHGGVWIARVAVGIGILTVVGWGIYALT